MIYLLSRDEIKSFPVSAQETSFYKIKSCIQMHDVSNLSLFCERLGRNDLSPLFF